MRLRGALAVCAAALGLAVVAPPAMAANQLLAGAGQADTTPPAFDPKNDEPEFALPHCPPGLDGKRLFRFEEPYKDQNANGRYDYPEPYCDANASGSYDGIYLSGHPDSLANRVRDTIDARAMAFSYGGHTYEVISIVAQGTFENYIKTMREEIMKQRPVDEVIVSSNHNESSPDTVGIYGGVETPINTGTRTGIDEYYMHKWLIPKVVEAGVKAYDNLKPASLWAHQEPPPNGIHIRTHTFPTKDDKGNDVAIDPKFRVLQARDSAGKAIFTMLNLAVHNQQYGQHGDHNAISGDWPGEFQRRLEAKGGMGMGVFLVGDNGSQEDPHVGNGSNDCNGLASCEAFITTVGQGVADGVAGEVPKLKQIPAGRMFFDRKTIYVPIENNAFKAAAAAGLFGERHTYTPTGQDTGTAGPDVRTHVSVLRIGPDLQFIGNPGEAFPALMVGSPWGIQDAECPNREAPPIPTWRAQAPFRFQIGLADDLIGYELPAWAWKSDTQGVFTTDACDSQPSKHSHSLETEGVGPTGSNMVAKALTALLTQKEYADPSVKRVWLGRYVQADGTLTRRPEGAVAVWLAPPGKTELTAGTGTLIGVNGITGFGSRAIDTSGWMMDFDGIDQTAPDVTTRGMARFACDGSVAERYYVDVYPALSAPAKLPSATTGTIGSGCGGGNGGGGGGHPCVDHRPPVTVLARKSVKLTSDHVSMHGTASDVGCAKLAAVLVSVARFDGHRCRFMQANGRLSARRRCRKPILLRASGRKGWSLKTRSHLTPGTYRLAVRAVDLAGNREQPSGHNRMRVQIPQDPPDRG
jgi:hypothetical protein